MAKRMVIIGGQLVAIDDTTGVVYVADAETQAKLEEIRSVLAGAGTHIEISGELSDLIGPLNNILAALNAPAQAGEAMTAVNKIVGEYAAVAATGSISLDANPADGETITISDGQTAATYEFDDGVAATGSIELEANPANGDTITIAGDVYEFDDGVAASGGSIALTENPTDGDTITIGTTVFEFDSDASVTGDNVSVAIGIDAAATMITLIAAITGAGIDLTATPADPPDATCTIAADNAGEAGNLAIASSNANQTVVSLSGGIDAGDNVTAGNIGVVIGASATASMANLVVAINAQAGDVAATPATPADATCTLLAASSGDAYNVEITTTGADIAVTGMAGGVDASDDVGAGSIGVPLGASAAATMASLVVAINANLDITATPADPADETCTLTNDTPGRAGNVTITTDSADITVAGMSGGLEQASLRTVVDALADAVTKLGTAPAQTADVAAVTNLLRGKYVAGSGATLTCVANGTDYTYTVVPGETYEVVAINGKLLIGEADTTADANRLKTVLPGQTVLYTAVGDTLHFSTSDSAGIFGYVSRRDMD